LKPSSTAANIPVLLDSADGPEELVGGEIVENNVVSVIYDTTNGVFHIVNPVIPVVPPVPPVDPQNIPAGVYSNLKIDVTSDTQAIITADGISLIGSTDNVAVNALNATLNIANAGFNGLDTGVVAASTVFA
jgi:hypothetical protein